VHLPGFDRGESLKAHYCSFAVPENQLQCVAYFNSLRRNLSKP
jgi:hypothetical protein